MVSGHLLHVKGNRVRITSRCTSEVTYRLSEFQDNLAHLTTGLSKLQGTILDGELVCPVTKVDTGSKVTADPLQAAVAILAAAPEKAQSIQEKHDAHLHFHVFDILAFCGDAVTKLPLYERQAFLWKAVTAADNQHLKLVPSYVVGKPSVHHRIIEDGGEGTVWKKADQPYEPGRRVKHWIKRKRGVEVEAFVTGFKPGNNGHAGLVGALEFSVRQATGATVPIAWVSGFLDSERKSLSHYDRDGNLRLAPCHLGRRAVISGQQVSARSRRFRHARLVRWIDPLTGLHVS